jgi:hypothetical protein
MRSYHLVEASAGTEGAEGGAGTTDGAGAVAGGGDSAGTPDRSAGCGASCAWDASERVTTSSVKRAANRGWRSRDFIQISNGIERLSAGDRRLARRSRPKTSPSATSAKKSRALASGPASDYRSACFAEFSWPLRVVSTKRIRWERRATAESWSRRGRARRHARLTKAARAARRRGIPRRSARSSPAPSPALARALPRSSAAEQRWRPAYDRGRR